jgi:hypothetical protein
MTIHSIRDESGQYVHMVEYDQPTNLEPTNVDMHVASAMDWLDQVESSYLASRKHEDDRRAFEAEYSDLLPATRFSTYPHQIHERN